MLLRAFQQLRVKVSLCCVERGVVLYHHLCRDANTVTSDGWDVPRSSSLFLFEIKHANHYKHANVLMSSSHRYCYRRRLRRRHRRCYLLRLRKMPRACPTGLGRILQ